MTNFSDIDVDALAEQAALAHFGVLGMKWGRRSATTRGGTPPSTRMADPRASYSRHKLSPKAKRNLKIGASVAGATVIAAGAALVAGQMRKNGAIKAAQLAPPPLQTQQFIGKLMRGNMMNDPRIAQAILSTPPRVPRRSAFEAARTGAELASLAAQAMRVLRK